MSEWDNEGEEIGGREEIMAELDKKYFMVGISNAIIFTNVMRQENVPFQKAIMGFSYEDLESLHGKFIEAGVSGIFIQFKLMRELSNGENLGRLFKFEPIRGSKKEGILIPVQVDITEGRPDRKEEISKDDEKKISGMIDALNSGEISFEDFLGLS